MLLWQRPAARDGPGDQVNRCVILTTLVCDDAEQMEAVGVSRIAGEDLPIDALGLRKLPRAVLIDRRGEQLVV